MGPSHAREDVRVLLHEKDDRITLLETQLEAYSARVSTAHTRLMKTIDVLDALRSQHALEISAGEHSKMKLVHEVDRWRMLANNLEVERDELKDVVEDLIEKVFDFTASGSTILSPLQVQVSNEWSSWPCSRMDISKHAEQVILGKLDGGRTEYECNNDLLAYATSIIGRLRTELDFERKNHRRSIEEANLRIEELEAKVAVREAEIENYLTSLGDPKDRPGEPLDGYTRAPESRPSRKLIEPKSLSDEECLRFLASNNARNRSLELEIRNIADRLEQARMAVSPLRNPGENLPPLTPQDGRDIIPERGPRTRSASVDPNILSRPSDLAATALTSEPPHSSMMLSIAQLDSQIRTMTSQMDALVAERTTLIEVAAKQRRVVDGMSIDTFQDVLRVEGECVRLQAEVDDLREQLRQAHMLARDKENALLREIAQLRASSSGSLTAHPVHESHTFDLQPLESDIVVEESMELASPLIPSVLPDMLIPPSSNADAGADLVFLPFSPTVHNTPPTRAPRSQDPQETVRVQAALDIARTQLAQKEEALSQLHAEMNRLQLELQAQTRQQGDGS